MRSNSKGEEQTTISSHIKDSNKVTSEPKELIVKNDVSTTKKESSSAKINWDEEIGEEQTSSVDWKAVVTGDVTHIDLQALKKEIGEEQYKQYLKTLDTTSEGLISSKKFDKFI